MHWIQNKSVSHYPTNNLRQISFPPGAGYSLTQFYLITGGDTLVNCLQWLAFLGSIIGISLIAQILVGKQHQWVAALVCASIPMAIMQSMTSQTDLITAFWLVCYTYFILRNERYSKLDLFWIAASFSLAIFTKPTAIIFGIPFSVILGYRLIKNESVVQASLPVQARNLQYELSDLKGKRYIFWLKISSTLIILLLAFLSLSLPSYWRNYQTFGKFLGIDTGTRAEAFGLAEFISTFSQNILLNLPLPFLKELIVKIHHNILHLKIDDTRINFAGADISQESVIKLLSPHEDFVGSP